jgi:tetratricopeptide (TPR) repeat protein
VKLLTPEQMLRRLESSLSLLANTARDLPERQRTLRGAIDWSHALLNPAERLLFARLSIFRGGFGLDAAERVCGGDGLEVDVFESIASLVDKSLVRSDELADETRFSMLETIREYARERLVEAGSVDDLARRHAAHFFDLVTAAEPHLTGGDQVAWLQRLEREQDNVRAAFARESGSEMLDDALVAAGRMWRFWQLRGRLAEGRAIFETLLARPGAAPEARAKALIGAGGIAYWQADYDAMTAYYAEARALYESIGEVSGIADALYNQSFVPVLLGGELEEARTLLSRARELYAEADNRLGAAEAEQMLAMTYSFEGNLEVAVRHQARAVAAMREAGSRWQVADGLAGLAALRAQSGDWPGAVGAVRESMALEDELGSELVLTMPFELVAAAAGLAGNLDRAARLLGKVDEIRRRVGGSPPTHLFHFDEYRQQTREWLGGERFEQLRAEGGRLTLAEARRLAEEFEPPRDLPPLRALGPSSRE